MAAGLPSVNREMRIAVARVRFGFMLYLLLVDVRPIRGGCTEFDHPPLGDEFPRCHRAYRCEDVDASRRRRKVALDDVASFIEA